MFEPATFTANRAALYFEALEDLSPDLIELAVKRCIQRLKFFPRPAEIREQVAAELEERAEERAARCRPEHRLLLPAPEKEKREPLTPEENTALVLQMDAARRQYRRKLRHGTDDPGPDIPSRRGIPQEPPRRHEPEAAE